MPPITSRLEEVGGGRRQNSCNRSKQQVADIVGEDIVREDIVGEDIVGADIVGEESEDKNCTQSIQ